MLVACEISRALIVLCIFVSATLPARAENPVDDDTLASPAISDGRIYIRGWKALYCIGR